MHLRGILFYFHCKGISEHFHIYHRSQELKSLPKQRKNRPILLTGFKRSNCIFPFAFYTFLNCLALVVVRRGGCQWFPAGSYQRRLIWCRHRGGGHLYHFCFARRPPLYLGLTWRSFDVHTEALRRGWSSGRRWPKNLQSGLRGETLNNSDLLLLLWSFSFQAHICSAVSFWPLTTQAQRREAFCGRHMWRIVYMSAPLWLIWPSCISSQDANNLLFCRPNSSWTGRTNLFGEMRRFLLWRLKAFNHPNMKLYCCLCVTCCEIWHCNEIHSSDCGLDLSFPCFVNWKTTLNSVFPSDCLGLYLSICTINVFSQHVFSARYPLTSKISVIICLQTKAVRLQDC